LLNPFEEDVKASFKAFWKNNKPANQGSEAAMFEDEIDLQSLKKTIPASNWDRASAIIPEHLLEVYDLECEVVDDKCALDLQEFVYMNIFENIKSGPKSKCENCFKKTKTVIEQFFQYLDCNKDGLVTAENMFNGMSNMKGLPYPTTTTTMVNDFVLNTMEHKSAGLDVFDMYYGFLVGMYERVVEEDDLTEVNVNAMKVARRRNVKDGFGPLRK